jgi:hypothetical protein
MRRAGEGRPIPFLIDRASLDKGTDSADRITARRCRRTLSLSQPGYGRRGRLLLLIKNTQRRAQTCSRKSCPVDICSRIESSDWFYSRRNIAFGCFAIHVFVCDFVAILFCSRAYAT